MRRSLLAVIAGILLSSSSVYSQTCNKGQDVYFINGINTKEKQAQEAVRTLTSASTGLRTDGRRFILAYNKSGAGLADVIESLYQKAGSYSTRTEVAARWTYAAAAGGDPILLSDAPKGFVTDLKNIFAEIVTATSKLVGWDQTAYRTTLTDDILPKLRSSLQVGRAVTIIGHSQGALFVNDALYVLDQETVDVTARENLSKRVSAYFVAPAADNLYGGFVKGYIKNDRDILHLLGIGRPQNAVLYNNENEELVGRSVGDVLSHGFLTTYLVQSDNSAGHVRLRVATITGIKAAIEAVDPPCTEVWAPDFGFAAMSADPQLAWDFNLCASMNGYFRFGVPTPVLYPTSFSSPVRDSCLGYFQPTVVLPTQGVPLGGPGSVCELRSDGALVCTRSMDGIGDALGQYPGMFVRPTTLRKKAVPIRCPEGIVVDVGGSFVCMDFDSAWARFNS